VLVTDAVEKRFWGPKRATLIQDRPQAHNIESMHHSIEFDYTHSRHSEDFFDSIDPKQTWRSQLFNHLVGTWNEAKRDHSGSPARSKPSRSLGRRTSTFQSTQATAEAETTSGLTCTELASSPHPSIP
jgi:hypothetical protein